MTEITSLLNSQYGHFIHLNDPIGSTLGRSSASTPEGKKPYAAITAAFVKLS
jgi:hypothetical protein